MDSKDKKKKKLTPEEEQAHDELFEKRQFLAKMKREFQLDADSRKRYDYEWMVRDMYRRGYHFSRYQPTTQTVVIASRQTAKIPINLVGAQMRSIRNQVTSFRPKWECMPRNTTQDSMSQARYSGRFLDFFFDHNNINTKIKETITHGLTFSVGVWQIYYDEESKEVKVWLIDPFDFYVDRFAEEFQDAQRCVKAVRRPKIEIINNKDFDPDAVREVTHAEAKLAVSEYKQFIIQALKQLDQGTADDSENLILYEGYYKRYDEEGKKYTLKMVWTEQNITPLVYERVDDDEFDFEIYRADINPKEIYGESWMKQVMPINRVIDNLESSVYEYNHRVAKGRIVVDRDSGVRAIHNVHGEIISKNRGAEVKAMDMPSLPIAVENQIKRFHTYIEDIGGAHDATLGRMPAGVRSGIGVAELKQADSTNQADLVDNLEDFLAAVGKKILKKVSKNYSTYHFVRDLGVRGGEESYFAVVGENGKSKKGDVKEGKVKIGPDWVDLAVIGDDNNIRVTIGSWLGYTKEMMQEKVLKFAESGLIDQSTALRLLEFGNVDQIVQQTRIESLLKKAIQGGAPGQPPQEDQYSLAMTENEMMVNENKDMPVDAHDDHMVHIAVHQQALGQGQDKLVGKHISLHQMYMGEGPQPTDDARNQQIQGQQPQPEQAPQAGEPGLFKPGQPQTPQTPPPAPQQASATPNLDALLGGQIQ